MPDTALPKLSPSLLMGDEHKDDNDIATIRSSEGKKRTAQTALRNHIDLSSTLTLRPYIYRTQVETSAHKISPLHSSNGSAVVVDVVVVVVVVVATKCVANGGRKREMGNYPKNLCVKFMVKI